MDYIIVDKVIVNNTDGYSNFINIIDINDTTANTNISNTEIYLSVPISSNDVEGSIKQFFSQKH